MTVSLASEPPETKITRFSPSGACAVSFAASSMEGGVEKFQPLR